jgi:hypothetical protein
VRTWLGLAMLWATAALAAQGPPDPGSIHVTLGFGVDTSFTPVRQIFETWVTFLTDRPDSNHPSPVWSPSEQRRYRNPVLGRDYIFQGFPGAFPTVTVLTIAPAVPGEDSVYVIKTLIGDVYQPDHEVKVLGVFRVYAQRAGNRWVLSNAIDRLTKHWVRQPIGTITFAYPPWGTIDRRRANRAARFADSLAAAFSLSRAPLTYFVAETPEEMFRLQGLDFVPEPSRAGVGAARADGVNRIVFSGSADLQEAYLHEIAHVVLDPFVVAGRTHWLAVEGITTWTGGWQGKAFPALMRDFAFYLKNHWGFTFDSVLQQPAPPGPLDPRYAVGAVLFQLAADHGGMPAIRSLFRTGTTPLEVRRGFAQALGVAPASLDAVWRRKVLSYAR